MRINDEPVTGCSSSQTCPYTLQTVAQPDSCATKLKHVWKSPNCCTNSQTAHDQIVCATTCVAQNVWPFMGPLRGGTKISPSRQRQAPHCPTPAPRWGVRASTAAQYCNSLAAPLRWLRPPYFTPFSESWSPAGDVHNAADTPDWNVLVAVFALPSPLFFAQASITSFALRAGMCTEDVEFGWEDVNGSLCHIGHAWKASHVAW